MGPEEIGGVCELEFDGLEIPVENRLMEEGDGLRIALSGLDSGRVAAVAAYLGLLSTWLIVAVRTARGSVRGQLLRPPPSGGPIRARKDPASS